jgi:hypothetical protein
LSERTDRLPTPSCDLGSPSHLDLQLELVEFCPAFTDKPSPMPKSGQPWNCHFLENEPLFRVFERFAKPFRSEVWPALTDYAHELETLRAASGYSFPALGVAANPVRPRRAKRENLALEDLYDGRIALTGQVYCLNASYHDLFNVVVFCAFPLAKRALHTRQFHALSRWVAPELGKPTARIPGRRTREQDALTIFDEGGSVLVMTPDVHAKFLASTEPLEISPFAPESGVVPLLFGHALLEHLYEDHRALRSSGLVLCAPDGPRDTEDPSAWCAQIDPLLAARIADPAQFQEPNADCILELRADGSLSIRHPQYDETTRPRRAGVSKPPRRPE